MSHPSSKKFFQQLRCDTLSFCHSYDTETCSLAFQLAMATYKKTRTSSHVHFLRSCIRLKLIPKGFQDKFRPSIGNLSPQQNRAFSNVIQKGVFSKIRLSIKIHNQTNLQNSRVVTNLSESLKNTVSGPCYKAIRLFIHLNNRRLFEFLSQGKLSKLQNLRNDRPTYPHQPVMHSPSNAIASDTSTQTQEPNTECPTSHQKVVCIPHDLPVTQLEKEILSRGLKFVPLEPSLDHTQVMEDVGNFNRKLRLQHHFFGREGTSRPDWDESTSSPFDEYLSQFEPRSNFTPEAGACKTLDRCIDNINADIKKLTFPTIRSSNISIEEKQTLKALQTRNDIVVKPADKGGAIVLWEKNLYLAEGHKQLDNTTFYKKVKDDRTLYINSKVKTTVRNLIKNSKLPPTAENLIIKDSDLGAPTFYLLPKIHKMSSPSDIPSGRPIVSACSCPTERISAFLDHLFQPIVKTLKTYVKDTNHALQLFETYSFPDSRQRLLFTMDVSSLYTSIPHSEGLKAIKYFFEKYPPTGISVDTILELTSFVLDHNCFEFDGKFYQQINGVAMGTKMGPSYACLFMGYLEQQIFSNYQGPVPELFLRYIDDVVGVTSMTAAELESFFSFANDFHPNIKFTTCSSPSEVTFLDIKLCISPVGVTTSIHYKDTDSHNYLQYSSSHPKKCKDSIPYSQLLRLRRICQNDEDFESRKCEMLTFFHKRGYPDSVLFSATSRISRITRQEALNPQTPRNQNKNTQPKLILTYHPQARAVQNIILRQFKTLQQDPDTKEVFNEPPLIVFRRDRSIRDRLVRSRFNTNNPNRPVGTSRCSRNCLTCNHITTETSINFQTGTYHVHGQYDCTSRNVVYCLTCRVCNIHYVGETGRRLGDRITEHMRDIDNDRGVPISDHFNLPGHTGRSDLQVSVLKHCYNTQQRKATERRFIREYSTLKPYGLNTKFDLLV